MWWLVCRASQVMWSLRRHADGLNVFSYDHAFMPLAREAFDSMGLDKQAEVRALILRICRAPAPDGGMIYDLNLPQAAFYLDDDSQWTVILNIVPSLVVQVFGVTPSPLRGIEP